MTQLPVSVVVVSRGRPKALQRCVKALYQVRYNPMEIVVVADPAGISAVSAYRDQIKTIPFSEANISAARNAGIAVATGPIIAFIDDDSVPEPSWLFHLAAPFSDPGVSATGGFVRGRNGISYQWRAEAVDESGFSTNLPVNSDASFEPELPAGHATRTQGTNMAFRRDALQFLGGFDEAFQFYLDETDLNMRLAIAGRSTVLVPRAEVHHGYLPGPHRHPSRLPRSLYDIGASLAVFLRKHDGDPSAWDVMKAVQHNRLIRHLQRGTCEPRDIARLMKTLDEGWEAGQTRLLDQTPSVPSPPPFRALPELGRAGSSRTFSGRFWQARRLRSEARKEVERGNIASVFLFSASPRYHRIRFTQDGFWEQTGGLYGRSERDDPLLQPWTFQGRLQRETARIRYLRLIG